MNADKNQINTDKYGFIKKTFSYLCSSSYICVALRPPEEMSSAVNFLRRMA
jgi:hypothetical protein